MQKLKSNVIKNMLKNSCERKPYLYYFTERRVALATDGKGICYVQDCKVDEGKDIIIDTDDRTILSLLPMIPKQEPESYKYKKEFFKTLTEFDSENEELDVSCTPLGVQVQDQTGENFFWLVKDGCKRNLSKIRIHIGTFRKYLGVQRIGFLNVSFRGLGVMVFLKTSQYNVLATCQERSK